MRKQLQILVVDDEKEILALIQERLEREGFLISTARSCKEAFSAIQKSSFDLILCDYRMPDGTARDVLKSLKIKTPFFIMSGFADISEAQAKQLGALEYFQKPFRFQTLLEKISVLHAA